MSCTYEEELTAYVDGELAPAREAEVRAHLATCAGCQRTEGLLRRTLARLESLPAPAASSPAARRAVLARVEALPRPLGERLRALLRPAVLVPGLAAAALAVVVVQAVSEPTVPGLLEPELADPVALEVATNMELAEDYDLVGLESPDDLEVIEHLHTLEAQ